jgi:hypothetical protein
MEYTKDSDEDSFDVQPELQRMFADKISRYSSKDIQSISHKKPRLRQSYHKTFDYIPYRELEFQLPPVTTTTTWILDTQIKLNVRQRASW